MKPESFVRYVILLSKVPGAERDAGVIRRHVAYLRDLEAESKLVLCGPFLDFDGGMVVIRASSLDEARAIANRDPFVAEGHRTYEIRTWQLSCEENNHLGAG